MASLKNNLEHFRDNILNDHFLHVVLLTDYIFFHVLFFPRIVFEKIPREIASFKKFLSSKGQRLVSPPYIFFPRIFCFSQLRTSFH